MKTTTKDDPFIKTLILSPFRYSKTRRIRIADILVDEDESETDGYDCVAAAELHHMDGVTHLRNEDGVIMTLQCLSPRRIISRWLSALKRSKRRRCGGSRSRKREAEVARRAEVGGDELSSSTKFLNGGDGDKASGKQSKRRRCDGREEIGGDVHTTCSTNCLNGSDDKESDQAQYVKDTSSFNLGVACGLIYVVVESRNELAKMVELRKEMELLLQNAKVGLQMQNKDSHFGSKPLESNEMNRASSTTDHLQQASYSGSDSRFSLQSGVVRDAFSQCVRNEEEEVEGDESVVDMDRLEAELEAELERLEIHLDSENHSSDSRYSQQKILKADSDADSLRDGDISSSGDVIESDNEGEAEDYTEMPPCDYGVPPLELERRLHELLETRQEERIKELEVALEYAKHKLHEKEVEASWWKETATTELVSRLVPEPSTSSVASQQDSESTFHLSR